MSISYKKLNKINHIHPSKAVITSITVLLGVFMMLPLIWMISTSMKYEIDVFNFPIEWIPRKLRLIQNYKDIWMGTEPFALYYYNSIKVTVLVLVVSLTISCFAAYAFSRMHFPGRDIIFLLYIATMIIPEQITILPRFLVIKYLGLFDSHLALILNGISSPTAVFILRQFMLTIPGEFNEAARIDGAGHFRILWSIMVPIAKPAIATMAILKFVWTWNDYQNPLVFLTSNKLFTIQLGVKMFSDAYGQFTALIMAAAVSAIIPLFIVFFLGQRYVIDGISAGGIKG